MREPLLTDRLLLRDVAEADAELLFELDSDPEVTRYIGPRPADDSSWYRHRICNVFMPLQTHPWRGVRLVFDRAGGDFLGCVFVRPAVQSMHAPEIGRATPSEEEVGYRLHRAAWGQGIATEAATAFVEIALADPATSAVVGCALAGNVRSIRVLEKLGLQRVGELTLPGADQPTVKLARVNEGFVSA